MTTIIRRGRRAELIGYLEALAEGWEHFGKDKRRAEADRAVRELRGGGVLAQVGHVQYEVAD